MTWEVVTGHSLDGLGQVEPQSVQTCVTSPPYWGLRDYCDSGQAWPAVSFAPISGLPPLDIPAQTVALGLEPDPWAYVGHLVEVFRAVRRVLRDDGTLWLNLGDSFNDKQLQGIPWRVAYALQADGWYLRSDIIWHKTNPMPESVTDRPTREHEYLFLMSKGPRYHYDQDAIKEQSTNQQGAAASFRRETKDHLIPNQGYIQHRLERKDREDTGFRNRRSVWSMAALPFPGAHFATFPPDLPDRCIRAGSRPGDLVIDPFSGAGTTGMVARRLQRSYLGVEQSETYATMSRKRIESDAPLFNWSAP